MNKSDEKVIQIKRRNISKKTRFEVFKRDGFKCQYCGKSAPDVVLHVDHISPVSKGGDGDILNLVTACQACNLGKGATELSDQTVLAKQREQLAELNERREQLEMMVNWREGMADISDREIEELEFQIENEFEGYFNLTPTFRQTLRGLVRKYEFSIVQQAIPAAASSYLRYAADGTLLQESADMMLKKISGVCRNIKTPQPEYMRELFYIRGILRNRLSYCNDGMAIALLKQSHDEGVSTEELKNLALTTKTWSEFKSHIETNYLDVEGGSNG